MPCGSVPARLQSRQVIACAKDFSTHRLTLRTSSPAFQPRLLQSTISKEDLERVAGIEPAYSAWKAAALPLCYTRLVYLLNIRQAYVEVHPRKVGTGCRPCKFPTVRESARGENPHPGSTFRHEARPAPHIFRPCGPAKQLHTTLGGVDPQSPAPHNFRKCGPIKIWWRGLDSNQRRHSQRIYSPPPLATRAPLQSLAARRTAKTKQPREAMRSKTVLWEYT